MNNKEFTRGSFGSAMLLIALLLIGAGNSVAQKGGGGGGTDVIMRESFGMADLARPTGGKSTVKPYSVHTAISGFWIEYPGSKDTAWLAPPETGQTWRICASPHALATRCWRASCAMCPAIWSE